MKDNIYTIPLTDAFKSTDECPFCFIHKKLEGDAIEFMLGSAYMADDIREQTNKLGFCSHHYQKLYDNGNRLGIALMLHTHIIELNKDLNKLLKDNTPQNLSKKVSLISKMMGSRTTLGKDSATNNVSEYIYINEDNCYVCDKIENDVLRYLDTFFFIWKRDTSFISLVRDCKGFCLSHFGMLLDIAPSKLSGQALKEFYDVVVPLTLENLKRLEDDLSWFIDKFDYRNADKSWKTSKDAIPRAIQKVASTYVQD